MRRTLDPVALAVVIISLAAAGTVLVAVEGMPSIGPPRTLSAVIPATPDTPGAFGGIAWDAGAQAYWMVTDSGNKSRDFGVRLVQVQLDGAGRVSVLDVVPITDNGTQLTGADVDFQDLAIAPDGSFWMVDENVPMFYHVAADGAVLERIDGPASWHAHATNRGPEGMTLSGDGRTLYAILEQGLPSDHDPLRTRVLVLDLVTNATREYVYVIGDGQAAAATGANLRASGLAWTGPDTLLVLEHGNISKHVTAKRVFQVHIPSDASDTPLAKTLMLDLVKVGYTPQKPEGIVLLPHRLAVVNDNDLNPYIASQLWVFTV